MQDQKFEFDIDADQSRDVSRLDTEEECVDRFGIRTALMLLCLAFFVAAVWLMSKPSFEKCSALENLSDRTTCYEHLRKDLLKPPAKGAVIPNG